MTPDDIREAIEAGLAEIKKQLNESESATHKWRSEQSRIVERLTTILLGAENIKHKGLMDTVTEHQVYIDAQKVLASEAKGEKRVLVMLGGVAGAAFGFVAQYLAPFFIHAR